MRLKEKHIILIFFSLLFLMFGFLVVYSEAAYGGSDNYSHYRIARFAWKYPKLFLDHWGKPLFTILSSPFSLFGFKGVQFFNVFMGLLTTLFTYLTLKKLEYKNSWLIIFFVCFTPIYFIIIISGLTEILFSLVLIFSIYLFFSKNFITSSIIISFIIFSRTEGFIILPLFAAVFILERKYHAIPFLLIGFLAFSAAGLFVFDDFWWFFTKNPYTGVNIYGSGPLSHFLENTKSINGIPLAIALGFGLLAYLIEFINPKTQRKRLLAEIILIVFSYFIYLAAHSFAWWQGIGGSLGLIRVMAAVMPLAAVISLKGFNLVYSIFKFNQFVQYGLIAVFLFLTINVPFQIYKLPLKRDLREQVVHEAAQWLKSKDYFTNKIFYYDPYFCYELGLNPYDKERCWSRIPGKNLGEEMDIGSIIEWDAHFGPEFGFPNLDSLLDSPKFKMLKSFNPAKPFSTYAGYDYSLYLFQKTEN